MSGIHPTAVVGRCAVIDDEIVFPKDAPAGSTILGTCARERH